MAILLRLCSHFNLITEKTYPCKCCFLRCPIILEFISSQPMNNKGLNCSQPVNHFPLFLTPLKGSLNMLNICFVIHSSDGGQVTGSDKKEVYSDQLQREQITCPVVFWALKDGWRMLYLNCGERPHMTHYLSSVKAV